MAVVDLKYRGGGSVPGLTTKGREGSTTGPVGVAADLDRGRGSCMIWEWEWVVGQPTTWNFVIGEREKAHRSWETVVGSLELLATRVGAVCFRCPGTEGVATGREWVSTPAIDGWRKRGAIAGDIICPRMGQALAVGHEGE